MGVNPYLSSQSLDYFSSATMGKYPCGQTNYCAGGKTSGNFKVFHPAVIFHLFQPLL